MHNEREQCLARLVPGRRDCPELGDGDGNGMTGLAEAGWESMDGIGAAAGGDGH